MELCALVASIVHPEDELPALGRPRHEGHALLEDGVLRWPPAETGEAPDLRHPGRVEQEAEPVALRAERDAVGAPDVEVPLDVAGHTTERVTVWESVRVVTPRSR